MTPETRSLNPDVYNQTAIPWCTTHDEGAVADGFIVCRVGVVLGELAQTNCLISTGGPNHKWWRDDA